MRSRAAPLKAWAWTVSALVRSPLARTLIGMFLRVPRPAAFISSTVTSAPASKRCCRSAMLTGWVCVRNGSHGTELLLFGLLHVGDVDRLGVRAERLERHRLLHVRSAQLAHAHVNRHLPALESRTALGARARARALLAAAGGLARARSFAAADTLARAAAAGSGLEGVQANALLVVGLGTHLPSCTSTR